MCSFLCKNVLHISFCTKLQSFWFSTFRNSWMKIVSKDFCTFTGVYTTIYMGPCRRSYILLVRKFRTSEMLNKWSPTSKLFDIKFSHYSDGRYIFFTCTRSRLSSILNLIFDIFKSFSLFIWLNFEYWLTCQICWFGCKTAAAYVLILLKFSLTEFVRVFFPAVFLLGLRKKDTEKKLSQKCPSISPSFKGKCNGDFSEDASSGRQFFRLHPWISFLLWWYLSLKIWVKPLVSRRIVSHRLTYHSLF